MQPTTFSLDVESKRRSHAVSCAVRAHASAYEAARSATSDEAGTVADRKAFRAAKKLATVAGSSTADALALLEAVQMRARAKSEMPFGIGTDDILDWAIFENALSILRTVAMVPQNSNFQRAPMPK